MIEKIILDFLSARLPVPAYMEIPQQRPVSFVVIEKTGSSRENHIIASMITIQSYAGSLLMAAELNELVKSAMDDLADLDDVCRSALNSDYNYTDTGSKHYRYQAVFDITHY